MSPEAIKFSGASVDLSSRLFFTSAVVASPAASAETIIASLTITEDVALMKGVLLSAYCAFTAGTDATSANVKIRRTNASGTTVKASGLVNVTAASLYDRSLNGVDTGIVPLNAVYVLTLTATAGSAPSTVSAVSLQALVI